MDDEHASTRYLPWPSHIVRARAVRESRASVGAGGEDDDDARRSSAGSLRPRVARRQLTETVRRILAVPNDPAGWSVIRETMQTVNARSGYTPRYYRRRMAVFRRQLDRRLASSAESHLPLGSTDPGIRRRVARHSSGVLQDGARGPRAAHGRLFCREVHQPCRAACRSTSRGVRALVLACRPSPPQVVSSRMACRITDPANRIC